MQLIHSECVFVHEQSDAASVCPRPVSGLPIEATQQSLARVRSTLSRLWCEDLILVASHESVGTHRPDICVGAREITGVFFRCLERVRMCACVFVCCQRAQHE